MHVKDCLNINDYFERLYRGYGMQESNGKENVRDAIYSWLKATYAAIQPVHFCNETCLIMQNLKWREPSVTFRERHGTFIVGR
jgi:hypothetical protein